MTIKLTRSEQSRVNGAKSRGPKTLLGKARSSLNALKNGRYATNAIVLSVEDDEAFDDLVACYVRRIQPSDTLEYNLACELAAIDWRLTRTVALDTRSLDHEIQIQSPAFNAAGLAVPQLTRVMTADRGVVERSPYPTFLARREAQLVRARRSVLSVLRDLRKYFPAADSIAEVIPPVPLNPDLPTPNEPTPGNADLQIGSGSPECGAALDGAALGGAALQRRVESPDSASNSSARRGAVSKNAECASECGAALQRRVGPPGPASNISASRGAVSKNAESAEPIWRSALPGSPKQRNP